MRPCRPWHRKSEGKSSRLHWSSSPTLWFLGKRLRRPEDLRGKTIGIARAGNVSERLSRAVTQEIQRSPARSHDSARRWQPIGTFSSDAFELSFRRLWSRRLWISGQKTKGSTFCIVWWSWVCRLSIARCMPVRRCCGRDRRIVQRVVAAFAETVYFVEKNPDKAKAAIGKAMRPRTRKPFKRLTMCTLEKSWIGG